jgi:predicted dehydrogenase
MLRIALVGCGKIADDHVSQIRRVSGCEIVGVCDQEPLMARQLSERIHVPGCFDNLEELLRETRPDVVHVTTPPQSHYSIALRCLDWGCHVYVEKPFTINEQEARSLISFANDKGLKMTVGHDCQFRHAARRMRSLMQNGFLGDDPVHMESYYCYELSRSAYAGALLGDPMHWVRKLPGKLLHNVISHGIASIAEYLTGDSPEVIAYGFVSPVLKSMGETEIIDEVRVIICDEAQTTAYFTFSSQMRPSLHALRIYGTKNSLILDHDQETLIRVRGVRFKSYAEKFLPPIITAREYLQNFKANIRTFLASDFHMKSGMKYLIESFYRSITEGRAVPIPYREIILTARIMDSIFGQIYTNIQVMTV